MLCIVLYGFKFSYAAFWVYDFYFINALDVVVPKVIWDLPVFFCSCPFVYMVNARYCYFRVPSLSETKLTVSYKLVRSNIIEFGADVCWPWFRDQWIYQQKRIRLGWLCLFVAIHSLAVEVCFRNGHRLSGVP